MNYLYNGVALPALPEWDKAVFPYAVIENNSDNVILYLSKVCPSAGFLDDGINTAIHAYGEYGDVQTYGVKDGLWVAEFTVAYMYFYDETLLWTNTDILHEDNTVFFAASDPIPVVTPEIDPTSMLQGWIVGRRIAAQRGKA